MKRLVMTAAVAGALALAAPISASAGNPIFGNAKVHTLDNKEMKSVVGQNSTSAYYAYLGNYYAGTALQYGSYGQYLELFSGYQSSRNYYYYYAYYYAAQSAANYYAAYYYN